MDIRQLNYSCTRCGGHHDYEVDFDTLSDLQLQSKEPLPETPLCSNVVWMYKVSNYAIDTRVSALKTELSLAGRSSILDQLKIEWGVLNFDQKVNRFKELNLSFVGMPDEYYELLNDVVSSYCCGRFFSAMAGTGALGERILNRLILKTQDHYKSSPHYKNIYNKSSFDSWDKLIPILLEWGVISNDVSEVFKKLKEYRNNAIHYNDGYDFQSNARGALVALAQIIDLQFNYIKRKDLFWVFNVPGEFFLRSDKADDPFVKEFVIPNCVLITAYCQPSKSSPTKGINIPSVELTDEDFIKLRNKKFHPNDRNT